MYIIAHMTTNNNYANFFIYFRFKPFLLFYLKNMTKNDKTIFNCHK
jgi:hypothetical protein